MYENYIELSDYIVTEFITFTFFCGFAKFTFYLNYIGFQEEKKWT